MIIQETLTKENFWDAIMKEFPYSTNLFCKWVDDYKQDVEWNSLFAANENTDQLHSSKYKFHEIPHAMQQGIWIEFVSQTLHRFLEQPEYSYSMDLGEDIKTVFGEIEPILKEEAE